MTPTPSRYTLLIALSMLTAGIAVVGAGTAIASEPTRETHGDEDAPRNLTFSGVLVDAETGDPVDARDFDVYNVWVDEDGDPSGRAIYPVETSEDGSFSLNVSEGELGFRIAAEGYQRAEADLSIDDDLDMEIPMEPASEDVATVQGTVTDDEGEPIEEASVRLNLLPEDCEDAETCDEPRHAARSSEGSAREVETEQGSVTISYRSTADTYARTTTDANGSYEVQIAAGTYAVSVRAEDHVPDETTVGVEEGGEARADVELTAIPPASVTIEGQIVDEATGEPIPHADVRLDNQRWGTHNGTITDEEGRFQLAIQPGHTIVEVEAEESYYVDCEEKGHDGDDVAHERCDPHRERSQAYLPVSQVIVPAAGDTVQLDRALQPQPEPDTSIEGWVVNATSGEPVEGAQLRFVNEETNEWGRAETGEDGSFQIALDEGYYTVRVRADGYFGNATNLQVDGEDQVSFELRPGEPVNRHHPPVVYETSDEGDGSAGGASEAPTPDASRSTSGGEEAYAGGPGGLGAPPADLHGESARAPAPSAAGLLAAIVGAGWVARGRA